MLSVEVQYAIQVLSELEQAMARGERLTITELRMICGFESRELTLTMFQLRRHHWVESIRNRYFVTKNLAEHTLYDLVMDVDRSIRLGSGNKSIDGWPSINRYKHAASINLDAGFTAEFTKKLKNVRLSDLFPCNAPVAVAKKASGKKQDKLHSVRILLTGER